MQRRSEESTILSKQVGSRIREARIARGMSQSKLAELSDISLPYMGAVERGKNQILISTLKRIAEALNVTTDSLIRPDITGRRDVYQSEFGELVRDCTPEEIEMLSKIVRHIKAYNRNKEN